MHQFHFRWKPLAFWRCRQKQSRLTVLIKPDIIYFHAAAVRLMPTLLPLLQSVCASLLSVCSLRCSSASWSEVLSDGCVYAQQLFKLRSFRWLISSVITAWRVEETANRVKIPLRNLPRVGAFRLPNNLASFKSISVHLLTASTQRQHKVLQIIWWNTGGHEKPIQLN